MPKDIPSLQIATYGLASTIPAGCLLLLFTGDYVVPTWQDTVTLMASAFFGAVAYFSITTAMRVGDIGFVSPFRYTGLLAALVIGALVFREYRATSAARRGREW